MPNKFWCDYASHLIENDGKNFITKNFIECYQNFNQKFLCEVILDMPQETQASVHQTKADESRGIIIKAGCPCIVFKKEIKEVEVELKQDFMVTHRYYRIDDYGK
jgi:hypothetical protein